MIPTISWDVPYKIKEYNSQHRKYEQVIRKGKCLLAALEKKSDAAALKNIAGVGECGFKGRFGLRRGPLLVLFVKRPRDDKFKPGPIVLDNKFIRQWSAGMIQNLNELDVEKFFTIALHGRYKCNQTFIPFLNQWFEKHVKVLPCSASSTSSIDTQNLIEKVKGLQASTSDGIQKMDEPPF